MDLDFNDASIYSSSNTLRIDNLDASTLAFTFLKDGEYQIRIQAFDSNNISTISDPVLVKINKVKPNPVIPETIDNSTIPAIIDNSAHNRFNSISILETGKLSNAVDETDENGNIVETSTMDQNDDIPTTGDFKAEDPITGIQVSAPEYIIPPMV